MSNTIPAKEELRAAQRRVADFVHVTPVITSRLIDEMAGCQLYFKCENFQRMGAFKMRGASNAILSLSDEQRSKGIVTHSSGNFAQAVALSSKLIGCPANIVMPSNAPQVKRDAVAGYDGKIITSESTPVAREQKAEEVVEETGGTFVHPSDDMAVILGNSTAAQELINDQDDLDVIIAPVGGGGLIAGTCLAAHHFSPSTVVIGAEPSGADDAFRSMRDGTIHPSVNPDTICDGLRTNLGRWNFPILLELLSEIVRVDDEDTIRAMRLIYERMKIVVEPSSAITLAAVMTNRDKFSGKKVGLILSGGNVDFTKVAGWFESTSI